eukprot:GILJ01012519.1.p1 GENE.GILJ01012519.1~~GILJ01012519.1.p1  ORF type:complete len:1238 (+),score=199.53 GILJ01012519.1:293-3715(+)
MRSKLLSSVVGLKPPTSIPMDVDGEPAQTAAAEEPVEVLPQFDVQIDFTIEDSKVATGVFLQRQPPQMHTHNQACAARCWFPCIDTPTDRCPWTIGVTCASNLTAVSNGDLVSCSADEAAETRTFEYSLQVPTVARGVAVCVGLFQEITDKNDPRIHYFCPPEFVSQTEYCSSFVHSAMSYFEQYLGVFPYNKYTQVFLRNPFSSYASSSSLSQFSCDLLHDEQIIDQTMETRRVVGHALAGNYFGGLMGPRTWADWWLVIGLNGFLSDQFFRKQFGNNEFRFRLAREMERYTDLVDSGDDLRPLYSTSFPHPGDLVFSEVVAVKAPLVLHMIESLVGSDRFRKVIQKLLSQAVSTEKDTRGMSLSTKSFLKLVKKMCGVDLKAFAEQWIYQLGCPEFDCVFHFNKKKNSIELKITQRPLQSKMRKKRSEAVEEEGPQKIKLAIPQLYKGKLVIRVHELEHTYDEQIKIEEEETRVVIPCRGRARWRRKKKDNPDDQDGNDGEEGQSGDEGVGAASVLSANTFTAPLQESPVLWIRIDPDLDWLRSIRFKKTEMMWENQLAEDTDVVAQYEAVTALQKYASRGALANLHAILCNQQSSYRIRMLAAHTMATLSTAETDWHGLDLLFTFFRTMHFDDDMLNLRANDFSDLREYHVSKAVHQAISTVKDANGFSPASVLEFLLDLIRENDNSENKFSDDFYISSLIRSIAKTRVNEMQPEGSQFHIKFKEELSRLLSLEPVLPSYQFIITESILLTLFELSRETDKYADLKIDYEKYLQPSWPERVREAAIYCLLRQSLDFPNDIRPASVQVIDRCLSFSTSQPEPRLRFYALSVMKDLILQRKGAYHDPFAILRQSNESIDDSEVMRVVDSLWLALNSNVSTFDERQRHAVYDVYRSLWGLELPFCCSGSFRTPPKGAAQQAIYKQLQLAEAAAAVEPYLEPEPVKPVSSAVRSTGGKSHGVKLTLKLGAAQSPPVAAPSSRKRARAMEQESLPPPPTFAQVTVDPHDDSDQVILEGSWQEQCDQILERIKVHPNAYPFLEPVDLVATPLYAKLISRPMDISTMQRKLHQGQYASVNPFIADLKLIWSNCRSFNLDSSVIFSFANIMESYADKLVAKIDAPDAGLSPNGPSTVKRRKVETY